MTDEHAALAWHTLPVEKVLKILNTNVEGLSEEEARARLERYGPNKLAEEGRTPIIKIVLRQFADPLIYVLLASAIVTALLRDYIDSAVIAAVVILNAVVGFTQEYKAEESMKALKRLLALKSIVVRDGAEKEVDASEIVPGDVVFLRAGQRIPADLRLISTSEFRVNEAPLTGESVPSTKIVEPISDPHAPIADRENMAYLGTTATAGRAVAVTVATGIETELGRVSETIRTVEPVRTPLKSRFEQLTRYIIYVVAGFGVAGFAAGIALGEDLLQLFLAIIAMAVAAVPEGLPVALTIALSVAVSKMARKKAIIRHLPAVETLGSSTVIGSDKTGTLTRNEMTVRKIWTAGSMYEVEGVGYDPKGRLLKDGAQIDPAANPFLIWTLRVGLLANESNLVMENGRWTARGDPTEVALIVAARRAGLDEEKEKYEYAQLDLIPFESERRYMATLNKHDGRTFLLVKGAPEALLHLSERIAAERDGVLTATEVLNAAGSMADQGLRVIASAYAEVPSEKREITHNDVKGLVFLGIQGMLDPPRPEAIDAIGHAKKSGIRVLMITGDNARTAIAIARAMGILDNTSATFPEESDAMALTGGQLEKLSDDDLREAVKKTSVFARVAPNHKLRIVNALKDNGEIVAVTGDGVNDAAALKAAHVGVAMGVTGTDVAKEASDMVIADDNFATIYRAIVEGRIAFDNIRKVAYFLLTTGIAVLLAVTVTLVGGLPLILLPAQILWVNVVTNSLQDVALAFDPGEPGVEDRPPRDPREGVLNRTLLMRMLVLGIIAGAVTLGIFVYQLSSGVSLARARTIALTTIVFTQFFHVFNSRSERTSVFLQDPTSNRFLFLSILAALAAQIAVVYVPFMRIVFRTTPLSAGEFLIGVAAGASVLLASEIAKLRQRLREDVELSEKS